MEAFTVEPPQVIQTTEKVEEAEGSRFQNLTPYVKAIFIILTLVGVGVAVFSMFGFTVNGRTMLDVSYYYLLIACFLTTVFLMMPLRKKDRSGLRWYDVVAAVLSLGASFYLFLQAYPLTTQGYFPVSTPNLVVSVILFILILEAARRGGGWVFVIICLFFGIYPVFAQYMPGILFGISRDLDATIGYQILSYGGILGIPTRVLGDTLLGFLVFAAVLVASGAGNFFLNFALGLLGRFRGGPAKVSVVSSAFFGSLSGSIFANIIGTGSVTIPTMKKMGYPSHYAAAIEACASTGGVLMPPVMGAIAFVMAELLNMEYALIMVAAFIPALLYYFGLLMQVDAYAAKAGLRGLNKQEIPSMLKTLKEGWPYIAVLIFLIWGLLYMRWERLAPWYASGLMILLSFFRRETIITPRKIVKILEEVGKLITQTVALILPIGFILGGLTVTGTAPAFTAAIVNMGQGDIILILLFGTVTCYILGMMGMGIGAYVFLAVTMAPAIIQAAQLNTLAVHLFIVYYSMLSAITPPVALGSFVAASLARADPMKTAVQSMRLGVVIYFVPFFFLFEPSLIFQGPIIETVYHFALALVGVILIAGGMEGYLLKAGRVPLWARLPLFGGGFLMALPGWMTDTIGAAIAIVTIAIMMMTRKKAPLSAPYLTHE
ncbi:MAG TPA: TRAP transporter fused permease subunit, partial [Dehalococcoidales bacterium]|nr:TRAP transporter fused permease subunit [Dehalococcoidales bacterium]